MVANVRSQHRQQYLNVSIAQYLENPCYTCEYGRLIQMIMDSRGVQYPTLGCRASDSADFGVPNFDDDLERKRGYSLCICNRWDYCPPSLRGRVGHHGLDGLRKCGSKVKLKGLSIYHNFVIRFRSRRVSYPPLSVLGCRSSALITLDCDFA